jgi:hypothetical protein
MMKKGPLPADPAAFLRGLRGWRRTCVETLREAVRSASELEEVVKWGNLVYLSGGPVLMIRAEGDRVLLGFWRGQRLRELEPRLRPGGKYEMATMEIRRDTEVDPAMVSRLTKDAVALNRRLGDPTKAAERK